jgi:protein-L-isoaspartate(D-aspartate) O-methyltransferase
MKTDFTEMRKRMVDVQIAGRGITDKMVLDAFLNVPREKFVPERLREYSYEDGPLSIGEGQTISQPYIVALMTDSLKIEKDMKVLEVGAGSGYQAAILAEMGCKVYSIERIPVLAEKADILLKKLGYAVKINVGDGTLGWEEFAPYDRIIVTAGGPVIPPTLFSQLKENGRMIIPVGDAYIQDLILVTKSRGRMVKENLGGCQFVQLKGAEGWKE